jgi:hypothetical protein
VDIKLEEVEKRVVDHGDGAVELALDAVPELERFAGFFAYGERDPLDFVLVIFDVLARLPALPSASTGRGQKGTATHELRFMHST